MNYYLMNKNTKVLPFSVEVDEFGEAIVEQLDEEQTQLPRGFYDIQSFLEHRRAPKSRKHITELLQKSGCNNFIQYLNLTMALSLNDTFWVMQQGQNCRWEDVSLYHNKFNDVIAEVAFSGGNLTQSSSSPEFTTDGTYAKCWKRINNEIVLLKTSSTEGREVFSEYYASQVAEILCDKSVQYSLGSYKGHTVSICKLFTSENLGYVPLNRVAPEAKTTRDLLKVFSNKGFEERFRQMLVLDAVILNVDRHSGNYGFLVDNDSQKIVDMAPVFDHNRSFLFDADSLTPDTIKGLVPRIGNDFNEVAHAVLTEDLVKRLEYLRSFRFKRSCACVSTQSPDLYDLSDGRIQTLEHIVHKQVDNILEGRSLYHCKFSEIK